MRNEQKMKRKTHKQEVKMILKNDTEKHDKAEKEK